MSEHTPGPDKVNNKNDAAMIFRAVAKTHENPYVAFKWGKHGPQLDPTGAQVVYLCKPYDVLGAAYVEGPPAGWRLRLRTFDRSQEIMAPVSACRVLERTYDGA